MEENKIVEQKEEVKTEVGFDINDVLENPDFKKYMESYADKRVTDAVKKKETEYKQKLDEEKKKAEMTKEQLLAEKEMELLAKEIRLQKTDYFREKKYDLDLVDFVEGSSFEEVQSKSDKLVEIINGLVNKQVEDRLKGGYIPPKIENVPKGITQETFNKMGYQERVQLMNEHPELYMKFAKTE